MKFARIVFALATVLSLTMGAWAQEKTEKKAAMKKKAAEAVDEKKTAADKAITKPGLAEKMEKKAEGAEKKTTEKVAEKKMEKKAIAKGAAYSGGVVNLNTATKTQLMELPGVGEANADHIIKGRPYKSADELISRKIVQQRYYDDFKQFVTTK